ncbi:hypothetical protein AB0C04_15040 [Micromonospora sp. NPDC048909]|uniref:hypothetical protein n=1 Tax=Micromonospora sp. NPDC048909 TaxID=3155643 RepID=UPI0033F04D2E
MFTLVEKLAEIFANYGARLLDRRRTGRDSDVARHLLGIVLLLQDLCLRGDRVLALAGQLGDGAADAATEAEFGQVMAEQVESVGKLRQAIGDSRMLLNTVDAGLYLELAPFLDVKSGLLTRWEQQRRTSTFSTTTLFFLPAAAVDRVAGVGKEGEALAVLSSDRADYVMILAETLRETRTGEVRDIRRVNPEQAQRLRSDIDGARAELARARELCAQVASSVEQTVGADAMANLRRSLLRGAEKARPAQ